MQNTVYYIDLGVDWERMLRGGEQFNDRDGDMHLQAVFKGIELKRPCGSEDIPAVSRIYLEGQTGVTHVKWTCYCIAFPIEIRSGIAALTRPTDDNFVSLTERIVQKYEDALDSLREILCKTAGVGADNLVVMKNLSFGDACILCADNSLTDAAMAIHIASSLEMLKSKYEGVGALDASDDTIKRLSSQIMERFNNTYLIKRNVNYEEYKDLMRQMMGASLGSNDRKIYVLMLCTLLLRTIMDETSARWIYESGDTKYETLESSVELTRAYELLMAGFQKFLKQASAKSPYSDQVWSLFFITKTLLSTIVGRDRSAIENADIDSENMDKEDLLQDYYNFFGFVPYVGNRYTEVASYYPTHIAPDYCYGFLSIPSKEQFKLWSYLPAFIHEFYHYVPPRGRKERNEKILHLAVYSVMSDLFIIMTSARRDEYEKIVASIAASVDQLRSNLIDLRNDRDNLAVSSRSSVTHKNVENYRDTMKYNAVMQDLVYIIDFEELCTKAVLKNNSKSSDFDKISSPIPDYKEWLPKCVSRWEEHMTSFVATFSFAMREIRSDLSMCVILNLDLEAYIQLLAKEPAFADSSKNWVADSSVLRFGFMTRLLYIKELYFDSWQEVDWQKLCHNMVCTCAKNNSDRNTIDAWKEECRKKIQKLRKNDPEYDEHFNNMDDYLSVYDDISRLSEESDWYSVFENAMCTNKYAISKRKYDERCDTGIDRRCLIQCWGARLQRHREHRFVMLLNDLYNQYRPIDTVEDRCRFEYQSRLLFRDFLMFFEDIDLHKN